MHVPTSAPTGSESLFLLLVGLMQWFSTAPTLSSQGAFGNVRGHFSVVTFFFFFVQEGWVGMLLASNR